MLSTSKVIGSIDREVRLLAANVDECATRLMTLYPDAGLTVRRVPERFVLQAGKIGVTISLFRSRAGTEASAEVVLALWDGEVTFPGHTPHEGRSATQVKAQQFHIAASDTSWLWIDEATTATLTSEALALFCVKAMAERLQPEAFNSDDTFSQASLR